MDDRDGARTAGAGSAGGATLDGVWEHFYAHCFRIIHQCPGVRRLPDADREDCVQEVMVELVRRFGEARPEPGRDDLTGLIRVLSRNKAADIVRRRTRKPEVPFDDGAGAAILDDGGPPAAGAGAGPDQ